MTLGIASGFLPAIPHGRPNFGSSVEIVRGDLTDSGSITLAFSGVDHLIFTAGVRTGRFARRSVTRATEYEGSHTIDAARTHGFQGSST